MERDTVRWRGIQRFIASHVPQIAPLSSIEIGAGIGDFSLLMKKAGFQVTLADYSPEALVKAEARFAAHGFGGQFVQADMLNVPNNLRNRFEISMSFGLAEHFRGQERLEIIKAHAQVLKTGGLAFISVPYRYAFHYRHWMSQCIKNGTWPYGIEIPFSRTEIRRLAETAGLRTLGFIQTGFWADAANFFPYSRWRRRLEKLTGRARFMDRYAYALVYVGQRID
jgi:SAM-dependent methyltransferase